MKSEHLGIGDKTFLVNRLIKQAPVHTLVREMFKNADENAALAPENNRRIEIRPTTINGVRKLTFWNTGVGMSARELRAATDLSASINKEMSLDGNFGIGAKVSGLSVSPEGIRYRSCKNGEVNEVVIGYDEDEKTYVRFSAQLSDGSFDTVYDVTSVASGDGQSIDYDWTEVVLFGESPEHDTVARPIGAKADVERSFIATSIYRRFTRFSPSVTVRVDVSMTKGGGKDETGRFRQLKTLQDVVPIIPLTHEEVFDPTSGVTVRYIHDPKHATSGHSLSSRANAAVGSTTFCALVYRDERYDFRTGKAWSSVAPTFGIPFGSKVLTVEVFVPDAMALPSQYRDALTYRDDRSPLLAEYFAPSVRQLMPEWVKQIIRSESPESINDLQDIKKDLQSILDALRVPTQALKPQGRAPERAEPSSDGINEVEPTKIESEDDEMKGIFAGGSATAKRAASPRIRLAPQGAVASKTMQALERVPDITILEQAEEISERDLKSRAARFYPDVQRVFVNGLYPAVEAMVQILVPDADGADDPEVVRGLAIEAARRALAFRVGKAICFALAKRLSDDWTREDMDKATLPESLSLAADDYQQSVSSARRWFKEQLRAAGARALVAG